MTERDKIITKVAGGLFGKGAESLVDLIPFVGPFLGPLANMGINKLTNFLGDKISGYGTPKAVDKLPVYTNTTARLPGGYNGNIIGQSIRNYTSQHTQLLPIQSITHDNNDFTHGKQQIEPVIGIQKSKYTKPMTLPVNTQGSNASYGTSGFVYKNKNMKFKNVI